MYVVILAKSMVLQETAGMMVVVVAHMPRTVAARKKSIVDKISE